MLLGLAVLALLAAATIAHYLFWSWRLWVPASEDELLHARTADGWTLTLARRRPQGPARRLPVLLVHGLAVNRRFLDFGGRHSLSAFLAAAGFDCFALDLRGHGGSRGPAGDWCFDDYLRQDLPAALAEVARTTGAQRVLLLGHSQGALLSLLTAALRPDEVAGVVALAGPAHLGPGLLASTRLAFAVRSWARFLARMVAPLTGYLHLAAAQVSINTRNVERPVLQRFLATAVENVSQGVAAQLRGWMASGRFASRDGAVDYRALLGVARAPALFVAAELDGLAPPAAVRAGHDAWGGPRTWLLASVAEGYGADYGHGDLVFGRRAPEEIYPRLSQWMGEVDSRS
ncbi:MAG: alpha/beta fold hydrolase [Deltaproteobacteria bacterium]|nr:alpha/beta fold hydrolase [Deltaproteobacteria bacterium]